MNAFAAPVGADFPLNMTAAESSAAALPPGRCFDRVIVGGLPVDVCGEADLLHLLSQPVDPRSPGRVLVDVNGHGLALASVDSAYRAAVCAADVVHADGQPIVWVSRHFCSRAIPERTATTDLVHGVGRVPASAGLKVYFLGAKSEVVARAAARFSELYPQARLVGWRDGYFGDADLPAVAQAVRASGANVIFLGLGKPREQLVAHRLAPLLPASWIITCGGCLDFLAGNAPRAPEWMQRVGLEWAYRLLDDPKRLAWRYLWTNVVASALLLLRTRRRHLARVAPTGGGA